MFFTLHFSNIFWGEKVKEHNIQFMIRKQFITGFFTKILFVNIFNALSYLTTLVQYCKWRWILLIKTNYSLVSGLIPTSKERLGNRCAQYIILDSNHCRFSPQNFSIYIWMPFTNIHFCKHLLMVQIKCEYYCKGIC